MKAISSIFTKWIVSYLAVVFAIMLLPVFLITKDASMFEGVINYLFNNET